MNNCQYIINICNINDLMQIECKRAIFKKPPQTCYYCANLGQICLMV